MRRLAGSISRIVSQDRRKFAPSRPLANAGSATFIEQPAWNQPFLDELAVFRNGRQDNQVTRRRARSPGFAAGFARSFRNS